MRFGVVVSDTNDWTARAMLASLVERRVDAAFLNFSQLAASIDRGLSISSNGMDLLSLDGLLVRDLGRTKSQDVAFRFETIQALSQLGIQVINPPESIACAANKFATSAALIRAGIPTPRTTITSSSKEALKALSKYGKAVSKPLFGYKGRDIVLLQEGDDAQLKNILKKTDLIYLQEFIASDSPRDIRAFVVGEKVLGAIYRYPSAGQWISNLARGGRAEPCYITAELEELAVKASNAVGTAYSGVDLMETSEGLKVIEVNGTPSGKGIFEALNIDVTEALADFAIELQASK